MDNLERAAVTLVINGDNLVPSEITALLGNQPTLGVRKGERFLASHGKEIEARTGMWHFGGEYLSPPDINKQISILLCELTGDLPIWKELTVRFYCSISVGGYFNDWTGGITLMPQTLLLLAERELLIDFDLYAPAASA